MHHRHRCPSAIFIRIPLLARIPHFLSSKEKERSVGAFCEPYERQPIRLLSQLCIFVEQMASVSHKKDMRGEMNMLCKERGRAASVSTPVDKTVGGAFVALVSVVRTV